MAYETKDPEERIAALESRLQAQGRAIRVLVVAAITRRGSVFDSPLKQFFDAPGFWEDVLGEEEDCECFQGQEDRIKACEKEEDPQACEDQITQDLLECLRGCRGGGFGFIV